MLNKDEIEDIKDNLRTLHKVLWNEHKEGTYTIERILEYINCLEQKESILDKVKEFANKIATENAKKYKDLYDSTLVALNEFKDRDEENKKIQIKLEAKINKKEEEISSLKEQVNTYRILEIETNKKIENIEKIKREEKNNGIKEYKEKLIQEINNTKGTISKSKLFSIINSIK